VEQNNFNSGKIYNLELGNGEELPIKTISPNACKAFGISLTSDQINYIKIIHPEDVTSYKLNLEKAVSQGKDEVVNELYRIVTSQNDIRYLYDHIQILRHKSGDVAGYQLLIFDLTEIHLQKNRLELVLEGSGLGLWDWNPQTNEVTFDRNWAEMLGYDLEEIEFNLNSWESRVHLDDLASCYEDIKSHMEGKDDLYQNIHRMKHKDGSWVYIWDRGKIVDRDINGNPTRFTGTHTNVTAQKIAEQNLLKEIESKETFFAVMSHEIRTPINIIIGATEILSLDEKINDEVKKYLSYIDISSNSLLNIINDILEYSKMKSTKILFNNESFNITDHFKALISSFEQIAKKNGNKITLDYGNDKKIFDIKSDPARISQVLSNLISNANKFSTNNIIEVILDNRNGFIEFEVKDHGIGIDKNNLDKLFTPYMQESRTIARDHGGTGLGLVICKNIIEALGGEISVISEKGKGSTFKVKIPYVKAEPLKEEKIATDQIQSTLDFSKNKILIVEDNIMAQQFMKKYLEIENCNFNLANNGHEAIELCKKNNFDLILMDLYMPKMSGIEATKKILNDDTIKNKPIIIALTATALEIDKKECQEAGMNDFLSKPIKQKDLKSILIKYLGKDTK